MSRVVWKYQLDAGPRRLPMPAGAELLHVGLDPAGAPCVWALVDPAADLVARQLDVLGTGHELPDSGVAFVGSFVLGAFVGHLFDRGEAEL